MMNIEQDEKRNADGVSLLVSILVCYPEIGTISFDPTTESLKMTFVLDDINLNEEYNVLQEKVHSSILSYHALEGIRESQISIRQESYENTAFINIIRDVATLSKGEIALISTLIKERFMEHLITDDNDSMREDELLVQEEVIDRMLFNVHKNRDMSKLIGIREDGRVMIFNK